MSSGWGFKTLGFAAALWSLGSLLMVFVYLGVVRSSSGLGRNIRFATGSLATFANFAVYSALFFSLHGWCTFAVAILSFWCIPHAIRNRIQRLWFIYLAHVLVEIPKTHDPGVGFSEATTMALQVVE
jgi:hypothetical protein